MLLKITWIQRNFSHFFSYTQKAMHVSRSKGDMAVLVTSFLRVSALHYCMSRDPRCRLQICWCCWHLSFWGVDLLTCRQRMVRLKTLWERWPWCFFHFCICHNLGHVVTNSGNPQEPVEWMVKCSTSHPPRKERKKVEKEEPHLTFKTLWLVLLFQPHFLPGTWDTWQAHRSKIAPLRSCPFPHLPTPLTVRSPDHHLKVNSKATSSETFVSIDFVLFIYSFHRYLLTFSCVAAFLLGLYMNHLIWSSQ